MAKAARIATEGTESFRFCTASSRKGAVVGAHYFFWLALFLQDCVNYHRQKLGYNFGIALFSSPFFQRKFSWCDTGRDLCAFLITGST